MGETERENIRQATLEGLNAAARKGNHGGRPPLITEDMLHTVLRRRARGKSPGDIRPDPTIPTGKHKRRNPSLAGIYRALAEHDTRQRYPEAIEQGHADFAARQGEHLIGANSHSAIPVNPHQPDCSYRSRRPDLSRLPGAPRG